MTAELLFGEGDKEVFWQGVRIGTCGEPIDKLRIGIGRVRAIPDLIVGFDGKRDGWVIGASFCTKDGEDYEFCEVAFIPESDMDEDRFLSNKGE